jgi:hypothetical protein
MKTDKRVFDPKEIPGEVLEVWVFLSFKGGVGSFIYNKIQDAIKKYPEYFPWEITYKSIPKEVHEAYYKDLWGPDGEMFGNPRPVKESKPLAVAKNLLQAFQEVLNRQDQEKKDQAEHRKKVKSIWDKHYKKFNLEYRED